MLPRKCKQIATVLITLSAGLSLVRVTVLFVESWAAVRAERAGDAALLKICEQQTLASSDKFRNACRAARADSAAPVLLKTLMRSVNTAFNDFCEAFNTPTRLCLLVCSYVWCLGSRRQGDTDYAGAGCVGQRSGRRRGSGKYAGCYNTIRIRPQDDSVGTTQTPRANAIDSQSCGSGIGGRRRFSRVWIPILGRHWLGTVEFAVWFSKQRHAQQAPLGILSRPLLCVFFLVMQLLLRLRQVADHLKRTRDGFHLSVLELH